MPNISEDQVRQLAQAAGLQLDDKSAYMIASRLSGVLEELDSISDEMLAGFEPLPVFAAVEEIPNE